MTRYKVRIDEEAAFEECNGESRPLTQTEYAENSFRACPDHPRAGTKTIDASVSPNIAGCAQCGRTDYQDVPYAEYLAYYGNPDRHVYLCILRQDQCVCCQSWVDGDSLFNIDTMDDQPEASQIGVFTVDQLVGYLQDVAKELEPSDRLVKCSQSPDWAKEIRS